MPTNEAIMDLFSNFIWLRQNDTSRDDAWRIIQRKAEASGFGEKHLNRVLALAKNWETREGHRYHPRDPQDTDATIVRPPAFTKQSVIRPLEPPQQHTTMLDPTVLERIEQASRQKEADALRAQINERLKAQQTTSTAKLLFAENEEQRQQEVSYFGDNSLLVFHFRDFRDEIHLQIPRNAEVIIGRSTGNTSMSPDIDLAELDQGQYGISRLHAALNRHDDTLMIQDLGSANHTYLNDERLFPHELRMLKDGDVVSFAHMLVRVRYVHQ